MQDKLLYMIAHFGYIGIFGALVLGIIGLPVPDETLMTFAGFLISKGKLHYLPAVLVSAVGSFAGMSVSYFIGHTFGYPLLEKYGSKIHITKEKLDHVQHWFERFGKFAVTIGYFIPGVRHLSAYFAGISKWPYRTFFLYAAPGAMIWTVTFITLGTYIGEHWLVVTETIHKYLLFVIVILIVAAIGIWYIRK
ncbi:DedA family protein [Paenibacillus filicis]|uniref:DedA family protein n=1 Tax=Paenibacillus gyeongsangnamensis TaxID=3388067 RepID=A0ABT4QDW6_9BACL|nr:DedA family protein [Paenibacillus filicis]MCZ8515081.1 DedA family protein [Paenibacillus filicis]